jgi:hypothetical protein
MQLKNNFRWQAINNFLFIHLFWHLRQLISAFLCENSAFSAVKKYRNCKERRGK